MDKTRQPAKPNPATLREDDILLAAAASLELDTAQFSYRATWWLSSMVSCPGFFTFSLILRVDCPVFWSRSLREPAGDGLVPKNPPTDV